MLESPRQQGETEQSSDPMQTMNKVLLDAIKGIVYESHDEHVDYEEPKRGASGHQQSSSGGGDSVLPMLLLAVALGAIGYAMGKRSGSGGPTTGGVTGEMHEATDQAAEKTEAVAGSTAETIRETGEEISERTEETAQKAADRIEEGSEEVSDQVEEGGSEAADEMEDSG